MKSLDSKPSTEPNDARAAVPRPARQNSTQRAFVVQFDPIEGVRSRLHGRVEQIASGEHRRFRSLKELVAFMVRALRAHTDE